MEDRDEKGNTVKTVRLEYFAILREQAGIASESVETNACNPAELFDELQHRHGFTLLPESLRVAINGDFCEPNCALCDGDEVVFIPPVAGG